MIISIDGADGTGKTSLTLYLKEKLESLGWDVVLVREPGSTKLGEYLRELILHEEGVDLSITAEFFLYMAARSQLIKEVFAPSVRDGKLILCDRYVDSTLVYQGIAGGLGLEITKRILEDFFKPWFPDITLILDSSLEVILTRVSGKDKIEARGEKYLRKVIEGFRLLKEYYPDRIVMLDSDVTLPQLKENAWSVLKKRIEKRS